MPSSWVERRATTSGVSYRVKFRTGGRESASRYAGAFTTMRDAVARKRWVDGELANMRVPQIELVAPVPAGTLKVVGDRWRASRVDVAEATAITHRTNLGRILRVLGNRPVDAITSADVAQFVADLHNGGTARESIRKTLATLAMIFDFAAVTPNPARDRVAPPGQCRRAPSARGRAALSRPPLTDERMVAWKQRQAHQRPGRRQDGATVDSDRTAASFRALSN